MRGRKPIPIDVRRRTGDWRHNAPKAAAPGAGRILAGDPPLRRPPHLDADAARAWRETVAVMRQAGTLDKADGATVEALAVALGRARQARRAFAEPGVELIVRTARGYAQNPLLAIEREALTAIRALAESLGLSPLGRTRLGLHGAPQRDLDAEMDAALGPLARHRTGDAT